MAAGVLALKVGILDQSPVHGADTPAEALGRTVYLAGKAEEWGYHRFWVAEHHGSGRVMGSSPEVLVSHLLARTSRIRVGSGGVMLQHYSPYKVAENFNTSWRLWRRGGWIWGSGGGRGGCRSRRRRCGGATAAGRGCRWRKSWRSCGGSCMTGRRQGIRCMGCGPVRCRRRRRSCICWGRRGAAGKWRRSWGCLMCLRCF